MRSSHLDDTSRLNALEIVIETFTRIFDRISIDPVESERWECSRDERNILIRVNEPWTKKEVRQGNQLIILHSPSLNEIDRKWNDYYKTMNFYARIGAI